MVRYKRLLVALVFCLALPASLLAQDNPAYERGSYINKRDTLPYRILFPLRFDPSKKYPLVIILHGSGERGNNNEDQLKYGAGLFLKDTIRQKYPAIVVFPQCPSYSFWSNVEREKDMTSDTQRWIFQTNMPPTKAMQMLMTVIDNFLDKPFVNKQKIYVGGLSMGGMGTFELIGRKPNIFASAFAICGGDNTLNAKKYAKKVPLWIFHGKKDQQVPYQHSEAIVTAIRAEGGTPKYTLYPNDDHNSWNDAFAEPMLIPWLFSHSK